MNTNYYIAKGQKTLGPCTLDDLRNFLAYGSIQKGDLVMRAGENEWRPVAAMMEIAGEAGALAADGTVHPASRRRTVRYRDYDRVPPGQRAGKVLRWMVWGLLLFPPLLWCAAVSIYSGSIFRASTNEDGYLKLWPRWTEGLITMLIMVNAFMWWAGATWLVNATAPHLDGFMDAMQSATSSLRAMF